MIEISYQHVKLPEPTVFYLPDYSLKAAKTIVQQLKLAGHKRVKFTLVEDYWCRNLDGFMSRNISGGK